MTAFLIVIIGIWTYPVISLIFLQLTKKRLKVRKRIFYILCLIAGSTILGMLFNISTTCTILDWIMVSSIYLATSLALWWTQFQTKKLLKIVGFIITIGIFGFAYLIGSIGGLGLGFAIEEYATDSELWLPNGLIYKESTLGNAISDYRGKRVEIYKTIPQFPVIEWQIKEKKYHSPITYLNKLTVQYAPTENKIYLSASMKWEKNQYITRWSDTLCIDQ